jgi:hypothetical protein
LKSTATIITSHKVVIPLDHLSLMGVKNFVAPQLIFLQVRASTRSLRMSPDLFCEL